MSCKHSVPSELLYCPYCGTKQNRKICTCTFINQANAIYCGGCGQKILAEFVQNDVTPTAENNNDTYSLNEILHLANINISNIKDRKISQKEINALFDRMSKDDHE